MQEQDIYDRTRRLIGEEKLNKLRKSHVAVFGLGGVGGFALEALVRSGVGEMSIFDKDKIDITNINRQVIALHSTIGEYKTQAWKKRIYDINPSIQVHAYNVFYGPENAEEYPLTGYDYVVDAVDTVTAKLELITRAEKAEVRIISSMGAGKKMNPACFEVADIYETSVCPLARVMRRELKTRGIKALKVVYSKEKPEDTRDTIGSIAFVPSVAGLILAGEVVKELIQ